MTVFTFTKWLVCKRLPKQGKMHRFRPNKADNSWVYALCGGTWEYDHELVADDTLPHCKTCEKISR